MCIINYVCSCRSNIVIIICKPNVSRAADYRARHCVLAPATRVQIINYNVCCWLIEEI